jgi:hypothetical protein
MRGRADLCIRKLAPTVIQTLIFLGSDNDGACRVHLPTSATDREWKRGMRWITKNGPSWRTTTNAPDAASKYGRTARIIQLSSSENSRPHRHGIESEGMALR